ncbi:Disintegrin and metalloproteinase domain-containing protein 8 [Bagarius yarrelli]|uniref:Disintegrin and metalloproteinase domain-containing protein 8 n=1 Tax=Bagarius yarrelli TaxID=175774 RepID=A0A556TMS6_BAGYA|nr:Disintegrin and metalloproteinase domain-containing protein 8 [Bagarius yarrelli]
MRFIGLFLLLCSYISVWEICSTAHARLPHALRYEVVRLRTGRVKRSTFNHEKYPAAVEYSLNVNGKSFTIFLEKNRELFGNNYSLTYYTENGTKEITYPSNVDHCYYQGQIRNINDSSVSVGMCAGMRGVFRAENQVYLIEPLENSVKGDHAVYKQEHLRTKRATHGYFNDTVSDYDVAPRLAGLYNSKNKKIKVPKEGRYIEMLIVVDNTELYRPLGIRVMLVGLEVWSNQDQIDVSIAPEQTLDRFLKWRQTELLPRKKHDNAQFVTGVDFLGSTVGLAPLRSMCFPSSGAVNEDHSRSPLGIASTIAHEMGHNLGMSHDTANCDCPNTQPGQGCVMGESIGYLFPEHFSSCSKMDMETFLQNYDVRCLLNVPNEDDLFGGPLCGNAIVETGEECDCGTLEECENSCCNATTCRLTEGSECAHGECCDQCKLKQAGSLCRPSAHDCDLEEHCTGKLAHCPNDDYKMNGLPCNSNQGYCYNGQCPTNQEHCQTLWGPDADVADDVCFDNNCQWSRPSACSENKKCGTLYCSGGNEYPITQSKRFITMGRRTCNVAVDVPGTENIGMVPTGTKCGTNKVCHQSLCQDVSIYGSANCSAKCNNHGVCNHERQCHCDPGWAPPYCDNKLYDISSAQNVVIIVITTIGILLVITAIFGGLIYFKKRRPFSKKGSFKDMNGYPGQCNPTFQPVSAKNSPKCAPPRISQPTFLESSVTQSCTPIFTPITPSRAPPQANKPKPPPVPPVKASCTNPTRNPCQVSFLNINNKTVCNCPLSCAVSWLSRHRFNKLTGADLNGAQLDLCLDLQTRKKVCFMMNKELNEDALQDLYAWIDKIKLSRPKRSISRDFSDGVMAAEVVKHFFPKLVDLHNYTPAHATPQKLSNWNTLNRQANLNFHVPEDTLKKITLSNPGSIEPVLCALREKIEERQRKPLSYCTKDLECFSTENKQVKTENGLETLNENKTTSPEKKTQKSNPPIVLSENVDPGVRLLLEERGQALLSLQETVEILQAKVSRLEHLVHLKDLRIQDLTKHLEKSKARSNIP